MPHLDNIQKKGYVLEFGHLSRDKGTDTLLEVAKKMPNTEFVFVGYGPSVDKMKDIPRYMCWWMARRTFGVFVGK